jgi:hypothetical protein
MCYHVAELLCHGHQHFVLTGEKIKDEEND